jgi:hypothetical protein
MNGPSFLRRGRSLLHDGKVEMLGKQEQGQQETGGRGYEAIAQVSISKLATCMITVLE